MTEHKFNTILLHQVDRRTTLKWLAATLGYSALHHKALAGTFKPTSKGYGTDPNLNDTKATWERLLSNRELHALAVLSDLILPGTSTAPAPSAIGIHEFIDEWVSAPYPEQLRDRELIRTGLVKLDADAVRNFGLEFLQISPAQRLGMLKEIAQAGSAQSSFFNRLRYLVLASYFSSDVGMKDIGYTGNVALTAFPEPTDEILTIIDRECKTLGI